MKKKIILILTLLLLVVFPAMSQDAKTETQTDKQSGDSWDFFLLPLLETVFSRSVNWRPDWPSDIPPDAFSPVGNRTPRIIELSNDTDSFRLRRDSSGRLLEFPFFYKNGYAQVTADYSATGSVSAMTVSIKSLASQDGGEQAQEETWNVNFSANFLPYSELSMGGSFPSVTVSSGDTVFFVFFFESPIFLTETWYDKDGNMQVFCKAPVYVENGAWRITSMQIYDSPDPRFIDYFHDSYGNISQVRSDDAQLSAILMEQRPVFWQDTELRYEFQWDNRRALTTARASGETEDLFTEYRYEYQFDSFGNWTKRSETAYKIQFGLLTPQPLYSRGEWNRRIVFGADGG